VLKRSLLAGMGILVLAAVAATAADPAIAGKAEQVSPAKAVIGGDLTPAQPQNLFEMGGCVASIRCPNGSTLACAAPGPNGVCLQGEGPPPWVACNGVIHYCP
jgi:hypothetical protein